MAELVKLNAVERDKLGFWNAEAIDETPEAGRARRARERAAKRRADAARFAEAQIAREARRARDRLRKAVKRRAAGCVSRAAYEANSASGLKPWIAAGFKTRCTWDRHGKPRGRSR